MYEGVTELVENRLRRARSGGGAGVVHLFFSLV